jgi:hypothetical protein
MMFGSVFAIAREAVRSAVRSRLVLALLALLLLTVVGLPLTLKGDGTVAGEARILLYYTLGLATVILGAVTLWAGCGAVSQDIEDKQIRLIAVKPVRAAQIWLGKWLGLLAVNAVFLCLAGFAVSALLLWRTRPARLEPEQRRVLREEVLTARLRVLPRPEILDAEVKRRAQRLRDQERVPSDMPADRLYEELRKRLRAERLVVGPGGSRRWIFDVPAGTDPGQTPVLRFSLASISDNRKPLTGTWTAAAVPAAEARDARAESPVVRINIEGYAAGVHSIRIPAGTAVPGQPLSVRFTNGPRGESNTAVFRADRGMELLIRKSTFGWNLTRSLIILFCQLALLAAIGVSAGTLFSFPVATFAGAALVAVAILAHSVAGSPGATRGHHGDEVPDRPAALQVAGGKAAGWLSAALSPALRYHPLGALSEGLLVERRKTATAVLVMLGGYVAVLGLAGSFVLGRRELASQR